MIDNLALRWVVTVLFAIAAALTVYAMVRQRLHWPAYVGHVLHLIMALAMIVMAWPFSMSWPTTGPMIFFIVAAVWFLATLAFPSSVLADAECGCGDVCTCGAHCGCVPATDSVFGRSVAVYHAAMMGAMAWMYAVMNGSLLPGSDSAMASGSVEYTSALGQLVLAHDHGGSGGMDMPGMDMGHSTQPGYVTPINAILTIGFAVAAVVWLYRYFDRRRRAGTPSDLLAFAGDISQICMAAGMAIMFGAML
ncbi:DUF5134 domain-containing protein [Gordonia otitidis]|uniref:DUF5134 domain-containing protein n=1 Tax=Gordonia otitidis TaxID=249058 RepID=UPI001D134226|nr:DUF5134 domain-containing protein [Gordonia otitidis]UEA57918.1 DUF5134 domain-containing protein [Gordonia otitidis]